MMTVHKLSTGDGHLYYTSEVASGDQLRASDRELGDYYTVTGMPPGQWVGSGSEHFGLRGTEVTEAQMDALYGDGTTPIATEQLDQYRESLRTDAVESARVAYAEKAYSALEKYREGRPNTEAIKALGTSRSGFYWTIDQHRKLGNYSLFKEAQQAGDKQGFIDKYQMTPGQKRSATAAGNRAVEQGNKDWVEATRLGKKPGEYDQEPVNDFTLARDEQYRRFYQTNDHPPTKQQRKEIENRVAGKQFRDLHGRDGTAVEIAAYVANNSKPRQQSVAGFDHVFTPTKSVSMAWGLGDETLRTGIESAHEAAINDVIDYLDEHAIYARRGQHGREQIDTDKGLSAQKFRHYDSRSGDPNLHDHLVIANRVKGADGKWSTLDGRLLYQHGVAASELYNARIMHHINTKLGLEFTPTEVRGKKIWELAGISRDAVSKFSARSVSIKEALETVEADFIERHGHAPTPAQRNKLAQQATLATRPEKEGPHSLEELNQQWATKAKTVTPDFPLGEDLHAHLKQASTQRANDVSVQVAEALAMTPQEHVNAIMDRLESSRSTWRVSNINAEATRYFTDIMGGGHAVDTELKQQVVEQVIDTSVSMTPELNLPLPQGKEFLRADGTSIYRPSNREVFTSEGIIANEAYLVDAATTRQVIPAASHDAFDTALGDAQEQAASKGYQIDAGQQTLARELATSDKLVAFGIGPAGAGKTTASKIMVNAWTSEGATVHGLAPTAVAADVLGKDAGITATTIDSFLKQAADSVPTIRPGDVFLVDEVGMVSTPKLAELVSLAEARGAVVRGIGDDQQLSAIGAGGALRLIDREAGCTRLDQVHRFRNPENPAEANLEEAAASLALREPPARGPDRPFDWYLENNRVQAGGHETMVQQVFHDWTTDTEAGKLSLMMAPTNTTVAELNELAQARAIRNGAVDPSQTVTTHADVAIHPGDRVLTRNNNHRLGLNGGKDFVKNGDLWTVQATHDDGRLTVQHENHHGKITLPADYTAEWVELGYASTINRAQGATVDVARAVVDQNTERSDAYVALSRARYGNYVYTETTPEMTRDQVLENISQAYETNLSVHELAARARAEDRNPAERIDLYQNLSLHASEKAMEHATGEALGVTRANQLKAQDGWGALVHELADATEKGLDPAALVKTAHDARGFDDADDEAAVLHYRIKNLRARHENIRDTHAGRPLANITDDHLDRLIATAKASTDTDSKREQLEDPNWDKREFGMIPTDQLNRRRTGLAETMRDDDKPEYRWLMAEMDAEVSRRRWSSPAQKQFEEIARGEKPRSGHNFTIQNALVQEKELRDSLLPTTGQQKPDGEHLTHGVSEHTAPTFWMNQQHTPQDFRSILEEHHQDIGELTALRGKQIAAEKPAWAEALGEVPANRKNAERWHRVAGEVDAYRARYNIPDSEQRPIPKQYARSEEGAYLQAQVTEVHKRGALSNRTGHSQGQNHVVAEEATNTRSAAETPTEAETKIATQTDAAEKKWEEALMDMDTQWDEVITAWQQEETARAEHETAEENVEQAQRRVQEEKDKLDTIAEDLQGQVNRDYAPVARAEQDLEEANFFTRGSRTKDLEEEREQFKTKYGFDDPDAAYNQDWLEKDDTYSAQKTALDEADEELDSAQQRAQETGQALETAHQSTQEAYDSYAQVREDNPATRVTRPEADESKNQARLDKAERRDMSALQRGQRPTDRLRNERDVANWAQGTRQKQRKTQSTQTQSPAVLDQQRTQKNSRSL